jgi:hypothetical protein
VQYKRFTKLSHIPKFLIEFLIIIQQQIPLPLLCYNFFKITDTEITNYN